VRLSSQDGRPIDIGSRSGRICIPVQAWRQLLEANHDQVLRTDVYVRGPQGRWTHFAPLESRIAPDPIDPYVAYRLIKPLYMLHDEMGLYQRDLTTFRERPNPVESGHGRELHQLPLLPELQSRPYALPPA
jgi:hypothetical protein